MQLTQNVQGVSKIFLVLLLLISFIVGALLSYIWTMGFYAPQEFHLPDRSNVTIENVEFDAQNAAVFNVTVLNPSYSPSAVEIGRIIASTNDGLLHGASATLPLLPYQLARGNSQTFKASLNWGNYSGQALSVIVLVTDGSGATFQATTPFMNLTIARVDFHPEISVTNFNITVESKQSTTFVDLETITVDGSEVPVAPTLPIRLEPNGSVTFGVKRNWTDLQGKEVAVAVGTHQGYVAYATVTAPPKVLLSITSVSFNTNDTLHFNITIHNDAASPAKVDITEVTVHVPGENVTITEVSPALPHVLQPNSDVLLVCSWNWSSHKGQGAKATVAIKTQQGFSVSAEAPIP